MPYHNSGYWVDLDTEDRAPCLCAGCREFTRISGRTPEDDWTASLVEPEYDEDGFDQFGFNSGHRDRDGYDRDGYDREGYDQYGFNRDGYDREGRDDLGHDAAGYDRDGFDFRGYNREGFNRLGYNQFGYDREGYDQRGVDAEGYGREGFTRYGYDRDGYDRAGYDADGWNRDGFNAEGQERPCDCCNCAVERGECSAVVTVDPDSVREVDRYEYENGWRGSDWLLSYSYTPDPLIFRRMHGENRHKTPYYGMEIEMTSRLTEQEQGIGNAIGLNGELLYFKADGSVDGFEMVTHPMTAKWAHEEFPWEVVELMARAGATVQPEENGLHIHVSRAGFKDEAHLYRWLKLWYRNETEIIKVAGRDGGHWGGFSDEQRKLQAYHAASQAKLRHNPRLRDSMRGMNNGERYSAVNLQNSKTVEVRLFAATTHAHVLEARFELVAGTVEYTRDLPSSKLLKGGWNWDAFAVWLDEHGDEYPRLAEDQVSNILAAIDRSRANEPALTLA